MRSLSFRDERGQGTVEYLVVTVFALSLVVALGAVWRVLGEGRFVEHALQSASHHLSSAAPGALGDVFEY